MFLALCIAVPRGAGAYQIRYSRSGALVHWEREEFPLHYYIDSNPAMPQDAVSAVIRAFQSWENVGPARLSFVYRGLVKNPAVANDGKNCIIWVEDGWRHGAHVISHATTWYSLLDGSIVDCDVEINGRDYDWSAAGGDGVLDIQNVVNHEVGHLLGFDDVFASLDETMFGFILAGETKKRSLDINDIRGSSFLYPLSATFEAIEAVSIDPEEHTLSVFLPSRDTPGNTNIILVSSCDWDRDGASGEVAAVSYDAESGFSFQVYGLPGADAGAGDIATLARDDWSIASGPNTRGMAALDADGDGFRDEVAVLTDGADGRSVLRVHKLPREEEAPALLLTVPLEETDSTTHIAAKDGDELYLVRKVGGRVYSLSLCRLNAAAADGLEEEELGDLPVGPDDEVLSVFPLEEAPGARPVLGLLIIDGEGMARIDFIEVSGDGGPASALSVQLPGSSPVLATSLDSNGDGLLNEIVLITE